MPFPLTWSKLTGIKAPGFGRRAEILGAEHLRSLGFLLLASPYRVVTGEVDIVALDGDCLVFVEVKARRSDPHPEDAVNLEKRRRVERAARHYRGRYPRRDLRYRFDILAVVQPDGAEPEFRLIRDAFGAA